MFSLRSAAVLSVALAVSSAITSRVFCATCRASFLIRRWGRLANGILRIGLLRHMFNDVLQKFALFVHLNLAIAFR